MTSFEIVPEKLALKIYGHSSEIPNPYREWHIERRMKEEKHNKSKEGQVELAEKELKKVELNLIKAKKEWEMKIPEFRKKRDESVIGSKRNDYFSMRIEYGEALQRLINATLNLENSKQSPVSKIFSSSKNKEAVAENVKRVIADSEARLGIIRTSATSSRSSATSSRSSATSSRSSAAERGRDVGGANKMKVKKPLKKLVNKPVVKAVKKPLKKLVKKPVVKPAKKKVSTTRARKYKIIKFF